MRKELRFFTVSPFHTDSFGMGQVIPSDRYLTSVKEHAIRADQHGIYGMVIYNFKSSLDPWVTAGEIFRHTSRLRPMVAVQPYFAHPYTITRQIATLGYMYGRGVDLNVVVGASPAEMESMGDALSGQDKYRRLHEYTQVLRGLISGATDFAGDYYRAKELEVYPPVEAGLAPELFIPGSSESSASIVKQFADSSLLMAKPISFIRNELSRLDRPGIRHAMIIGIVARETDEAAWSIVRSEEADRRAQRTTRMFVSRSNSGQHKGNVEIAESGELHDECLWYGSAKIGIDAPKLVGSYEKVRAAIARYIAEGVTDFVLDLPDRLEEYDFIFDCLEPFISQRVVS